MKSPINFSSLCFLLCLYMFVYLICSAANNNNKDKKISQILLDWLMSHNLVCQYRTPQQYRHQEFRFLCWTLCIVGQIVSTKSLMAALSDCFPSSSCILLRKYWNLVRNNNIHVKETKIWLPFKTWCSLSVPRCIAYHKGN